MPRLIPFSTCVLFLTLLLAGRGATATAQEEFEGWHLEPALGQAHLVMAARVTSISKVTVVEGAKTDIALREYRFQPVRVLKGIFKRDELSMTASDLGITADGTAPMKEGEFRLLILIQPRGIESYGCVAAAPGARTFDERVPLLNGPDDPLVAVVETLIQVADSRSRQERAKLLVDRLENTSGLAAVPLLSSLQLRADWAAADKRAFAAVTRIIANPQPAIRGAAVETLRGMLASQIKPDDPQDVSRISEALYALFAAQDVVTRVRLAALESLGHLLSSRAKVPWARELLTVQMTSAPTYAERAVAATALSQTAHLEAAPAILEALAGLPLDEAPARESIYARAAVRLDEAGAKRALLHRLERSLAARQSLEAEVEGLGRLRGKEGVPLLLSAAGRFDLVRGDRYHIAVTLGRTGDDRAVPQLVSWLRGEDHQLKELALSALESIDSPLAAREVRPLLKLEGNLHLKLRIARLIARHGINDGYALATEHLADADHTASAALVLVALNDQRTASDLSTVMAARADRRWRAAALTGLAAMGDAEGRKQLFEILADDRHPLAADAAAAAGLTADSAVLLPLAKLTDSRNRRIALASLVSLRRFLSGVRSAPRGLAAVAQFDEADEGELFPVSAIEIPADVRETVAAAVAAQATNTYIDLELRREALAVARLLGVDSYAKLLSTLADQAELEGTPLLIEVQAEERRLRRIARLFTCSRGQRQSPLVPELRSGTHVTKLCFAFTSRAHRVCMPS